MTPAQTSVLASQHNACSAACLPAALAASAALMSVYLPQGGSLCLTYAYFILPALHIEALALLNLLNAGRRPRNSCFHDDWFLKAGFRHWHCEQNLYAHCCLRKPARRLNASKQTCGAQELSQQDCPPSSPILELRMIPLVEGSHCPDYAIIIGCTGFDKKLTHPSPRN